MKMITEEPGKFYINKTNKIEHQDVINLSKTTLKNSEDNADDKKSESNLQSLLSLEQIDVSASLGDISPCISPLVKGKRSIYNEFGDDSPQELNSIKPKKTNLFDIRKIFIIKSRFTFKLH